MTKKKRNAYEVLSKYIGIIEAPPDWSKLDVAQLWTEVQRLRAENDDLRRFIYFVDQLPPGEHWDKHIRSAARIHREQLEAAEKDDA